MPDRLPTERRFWHKFRDAFRGLVLGVRGQSSFAVHVLCAVLVVVAAGWWRVSVVEWALLALSITVVLAAEMFNSALEHLAKAVDENDNPHLGAALDVASAAVLIAAIGASVVGASIFVPRLFPPGHARAAYTSDTPAGSFPNHEHHRTHQRPSAARSALGGRRRSRSDAGSDRYDQVVRR